MEIDLTRLSFQVLCGKYLIHPAIALENEKIIKALIAKDDEEVERLLKEEF